MQLDSKLRFDNFVVGSSNRLAVAAARAVADAPGAVYNPLFMYSGSGLGKTHLMSAIGNLVMAKRGLVVELVTLDDFVEQLHAAVAAGVTEQFKEKYLKVGLLLIDDMQFLTGHRETQSELLRIFNALQTDGRQIVMTSDRPPSDIADVDERLLTRLSGGLIVDMGAPDYETRMAILKAKCEERGVRFKAGVIDELGRLEFENVRELQGALNRLIAFQTLGGEQIAPDQVLGILGDLADQRVSAAPQRVSGEFARFLSEITSVVSQHVEQWKTRITEGIDYWRGEGFRTGPLERALGEPVAPPSVETLLREFDASVSKLRDLQKQITRVDAGLASHDAFKDPDRLSEAEQLLERALRTSAPPPGPSAAFTRAGFEVSASNQLAVRAADAIVSVPGSRYNPLFIHGSSGVGKTHLMNAIGNGLVQTAGKSVACVPAQLFVDELIAALQEGTVDRWRARYRAAGALLLDDVQFVAGKERTQEELFHVFNALYADGKQLVIASDRPARELSGLEERLRSRFEGGLVVQMQPPDRPLRERLFARFMSDLGVEPTPEMLSYLAEKHVSSVREIIGMANRILASAEVAAVPVTIGFIRAQLEPEDHEASRTAALRAAADPFFLDREKVVWQWQDATARLIEEFR
ncbi:MAG TPA: DnaA/Hda family protein [Gemmatimonadaceae bacterium]|jgi:chromosomal replication initiation ATPase DnaA|nr:DnaA/Hda family protein [Gemmatimonadaceae bacterium]